jgi:hypothetical protein
VTGIDPSRDIVHQRYFVDDLRQFTKNENVDIQDEDTFESIECQDVNLVHCNGPSGFVRRRSFRKNRFLYCEPRDRCKCIHILIDQLTASGDVRGRIDFLLPSVHRVYSNLPLDVHGIDRRRVKRDRVDADSSTNPSIEPEGVTSATIVYRHITAILLLLFLDNDPSLWPMAAEIESPLASESLLRRISIENEDPHGEHDPRYRTSSHLRPAESLVRDEQLIPSVFSTLLAMLEQFTSLDRIQSLRVVSLLLFNDPNIDSILERFHAKETHDDADSKYVLLKRTENASIYSCPHRHLPDFDLAQLTGDRKMVRELLDDRGDLRRRFSDTFISHFTPSKAAH